MLQALPDMASAILLAFLQSAGRPSQWSEAAVACLSYGRDSFLAVLC